MFRLAHLSDCHLGPLPKVRWRELMSKRVTGYINWHRNRADILDEDVIANLIVHMKEAKPDHIALTGDLVNLALGSELEGARLFLETLAPPENLSVVPGNHDAYVSGSLRKIQELWAPWMLGDGDKARLATFPYLRRRGIVALIGVNSARATAPLMATGSFRSEQAKATAKLLQETRDEGLFRVVMIHHPPFRDATAYHKRLVGSSRFRKMISKSGAELVLHGHTHLATLEWIEGPRGMVPVAGVPSASHGLALNSSKPGSRYNLFEISGERGAWSCKQMQHGYQNPEEGVQFIGERMLMDDGIAASI